MSTIAELINKAGIRQAEDVALIDLLVQIYEAGFAHGAGTHVMQLYRGPLSGAELVELIALVRQRRWEMHDSADYADAPILEV